MSLSCSTGTQVTRCWNQQTYADRHHRLLMKWKQSTTSTGPLSSDTTAKQDRWHTAGTGTQIRPAAVAALAKDDRHTSHFDWGVGQACVVVVVVAGSHHWRGDRLDDHWYGHWDDGHSDDRRWAVHAGDTEMSASTRPSFQGRKAAWQYQVMSVASRPPSGHRGHDAGAGADGAARASGLSASGGAFLGRQPSAAAADAAVGVLLGAGDGGRKPCPRVESEETRGSAAAVAAPAKCGARWRAPSGYAGGDYRGAKKSGCSGIGTVARLYAYEYDAPGALNA